MATNKKPTTAVTLRIPSSTRPRRMIQNFHLVWLDGNIDDINNEDCHNSISTLQQVVNTVNTFTDVDECVDFITDIKEEKAFMIVSGEFSQIIVPLVQHITPVSYVYIFCDNPDKYEKWTEQWRKVKGVFTDITPICDSLKQDTRDCDQNSVSISFINTTDGTLNQNLDELDKSFMYTQILKEILFTIDFEQSHIDEFLAYCGEQFLDNNAQLENIQKLQKEYRLHQPIWWYTHQYFLYSMLNRALRTMEINLIIKMGFFLRDLHNHIVTLHSEQYDAQNHSDSFVVYRGQGLSPIDFDQLMKTKGGLMSFNNFLSTSLDRTVSFAFAESTLHNPDLIGVLFEITIDPSIPSPPFANIRNVSVHKDEEEILFSMNSIFRIGKIKQIDEKERFWQVQLTLTGDNDAQLHVLTECIRNETSPHATGLYRMSKLLIKLGQFDKAQQVCEIMLDQTTQQCEKANIYQMLGEIKFQQEKYVETLPFYDKSIEILEKMAPPNHSSLSAAYSNVGLLYERMGEYSKALSACQKALEIQQKFFPSDHLRLAMMYNNIGLVYGSMNKYPEALLNYEKAHEIIQKVLPPNHPILGASYNNIGVTHCNLGEYSKSVLCCEKALAIQEKILPPDHPDLARSYLNSGLLHKTLGDYSKALPHFEKALEILLKTFSLDHPNMVATYNHIASIYNYVKHYLKALVYFEKAHGVIEKSVSSNDPRLVTSYNNMGATYFNMRDYPKALPYFKKVIEISEKTLSPYHPRLAKFYSNVAMLYYDMSDHSNALMFIKRAVDIAQHSLPENHPDIENYQKSLAIIEKTLFGRK